MNRHIHKKPSLGLRNTKQKLSCKLQPAITAVTHLNGGPTPARWRRKKPFLPKN